VNPENVPFFSVVIPTYNRRDLLRLALESVWSQTFASFEIIVVDDGSTDKTWDDLQALGSRVRALRQQNAGPGAARNLGAANAKGRYLVFHDSDDVLTPWALETFHHAISRRRNVSHLIGNSYIIEKPAGFQIKQVHRAAYNDEFSEDFLKCSPVNRIWASCFAVVERSLFADVGGFDESIHCHEDQDLGLKLAMASGFVRILSPCTVCINRTENSLSRGNLGIIYTGITAIMDRENAGSYPGGMERQAERRSYISVNVRNQSLNLLRNGAIKPAWSLYQKSFGWHLKLLRLRFLFGFPVFCLRDWAMQFCKAKWRAI
jgi:glycosyltransferase involved in cell wall biosynthesis